MFLLPQTTLLDKFIPKETFSKNLNTSQKKLMSEVVQKITWKNKIAFETVNIPKGTIEEIEIFDIELKKKTDIDSVFSAIDKTIPYQIVCWIHFNGQAYICTAAKHNNPVDKNKSVIDYLFKTDWFTQNTNPYQFELRFQNNLDDVYAHFCSSIARISSTETRDLNEIVNAAKKRAALEREIFRLKTSLQNCNQFNKKVELNIKLKKKLEELANFK